VVLGFELKAYTLNPFHQPIFMMVFFEIMSHKLFAWGWLRSMILQISEFLSS
jgi:hypothetical protein